MDFVGYQIPVIICIVIGTGLLVFELFMPGTGIPGIAGVVFLAGAVALLWLQHGPVVGVLALAALILIVFAIVAFIVKAYSKDGRLGKKFGLLGASGKEALLDKDLEALIGKDGEALSVLRPSGIALIEGKRYNVVSNSEFISKGAKLKVIAVDGVKIVVENI